MPVAPTYRGVHVYIEELPSGVRTITVATPTRPPDWQPLE